MKSANEVAFGATNSTHTTLSEADVRPFSEELGQKLYTHPDSDMTATSWRDSMLWRAEERDEIDGMDDLVSKLATAFDLDDTEVEAVLSELADKHGLDLDAAGDHGELKSDDTGQKAAVLFGDDAVEQKATTTDTPQTVSELLWGDR